MMLLKIFTVGLFLCGMAGMAKSSSLSIIGTVDYTAATYNLVYDSDSTLVPITWLDYSNNADGESRVSEATSGGGLLSNGTIYPAYYASAIDWETGWRLPEAHGAGGVEVKGDHNYSFALRPGYVNVSPVSEPGTFLLLGTGLASLVLSRTRKKKD